MIKFICSLLKIFVFYGLWILFSEGECFNYHYNYDSQGNECKELGFTDDTKIFCIFIPCILVGFGLMLFIG